MFDSELARAPSRMDRAVLFVILLLGLALRLPWLGSRPYWHDEVFSLIACEDLTKLFQGNLLANHPPLTYVLVHFWRMLGMDHSEWTMRLLPLLGGMAGLAAIYFLGKRLAGVRAGLAAAFLLAINPMHVLHSQELKEYIYLPCVATVMIYCFYEATESNRPRWWLAYALMAGLACHTELFVAPVLVAINLWFLAQLRGRVNRLPGWFLGNIGGALLFLPVLPLMLRKAGDTLLRAPDWWVPAPSPRMALFFLKTVAFGYSGLKPHFALAMILFYALVLAGAIAIWKQDWRKASLLAGWFVFPTAFIYVMSHFTQSVFLFRSMLPFAIPLFVLAGAGLAACRPWPMRGTLALAIGLLAACSLNEKYHDRYPPLEMPHRPGVHPSMASDVAARFVADQWQEGDILIHSGGATWLPFYWYGFRDRLMYTGTTTAAFRDYCENSIPHNNDIEAIQRYYPRYLRDITRDKDRVWFIFGEWERENFKYNPTDAWRWLDAHWTEAQHTTFKNIEVFLYVRNVNGTPVQHVACTEDDGVTTHLTYAGGLEGPYVKTRPDAGVIASPAEARRGNLTLRFDAPPAQPATRIAQGGGPTRTVGFCVENRAGTAIPCRIALVVSDALVDFTGLDEEDPERRVWSIGQQCNGMPPPREYDFCVANANTSTASDTLRGEAVFPAGVFTPLVYVFGTPEDRGAARGCWDLWVGGTNLFGPPLRNRPEVQGWQWVIGPAITIPDSAGTTPVRIEAGPTPGLPASYVNAGYLALVKSSRLPAEPHSRFVFTPWPGDVAIPAGRAYRASAEIDADAPRVDIWVYERTENGRVYRVFQTAPPM